MSPAFHNNAIAHGTGKLSGIGVVFSVHITHYYWPLHEYVGTKFIVSMKTVYIDQSGVT